MKNPILIIIILTISLNVYSQEKKYVQTVRGIVVDVDTEVPIPGVNIIIVDSDPVIGTVTDIDGEFKLENISLGRISIKASYVGYKPVMKQNILLSSGREGVLDISMKQSVIEAGEIVITANRGKDKATNEMAMVSARSFSVEETEKYAGSLGDPSRMAANFAGVSVVGDARNDIVIRGNSPIGLLWRLNGIDIPNPNHFGALGTTGGPVSMINNNLLANSDFYTGAFPAQYGNATSGVFDLKMRKGNNQEREYVGQIGFNGFELGAEGPFTKKAKASYLVNFRWSTQEVINKIGINSETGSSVPEYKDLSFNLNFPLKKGKISIFGIGGLSYIELLDKGEEEYSYGVSGTNTYFGSDMGVAAINHLHYFNDNTRINTNFSIQAANSHTKLDSLDSNRTPYPYVRSNFLETKYSLSSTLKSKLNTKNILTFGVIADYYKVDFVDSVLRENPIVGRPDFEITKDNTGSFMFLQVFTEWQHRFTDDLTLYTGVHYQHMFLNDSYSIEPRVALKWSFAPKHSINLGGGMHSQLQPHMNYYAKTELQDGSYIETNKDLEFTKSNQVILGYDFLVTKNFRIKLETYYQHLYNIPVSPIDEWYSSILEGASFGISSADSLVNEGKGKNYGVELTIEKFFTKNFYFLATGSLFESKYKGYDGIERNTAFNGNYVLNGLFGYEFKIGRNALAFDFRGVWAGGKRQIPILLDESIVDGEAVYDYDRIFEKRNDDYIKLDIRISFIYNLKRTNHEFALDIQNVTNNKNVFMTSYDPTKEKINTDYQTGIYPMFTYRFRF